MWHDLGLLWISQISCVWGLADGGRLESWFVPCLAATMCLALDLKVAKDRPQTPTSQYRHVAAWSLFVFNFVNSIYGYRTEDFWALFQPALVTLPLLLATDL